MNERGTISESGAEVRAKEGWRGTGRSLPHNQIDRLRTITWDKIVRASGGIDNYLKSKRQVLPPLPEDIPLHTPQAPHSTAPVRETARTLYVSQSPA